MCCCVAALEFAASPAGHCQSEQGHDSQPGLPRLAFSRPKKTFVPYLNWLASKFLKIYNIVDIFLKKSTVVYIIKSKKFPS